MEVGWVLLLILFIVFIFLFLMRKSYDGGMVLNTNIGCIDDSQHMISLADITQLQTFTQFILEISASYDINITQPYKDKIKIIDIKSIPRKPNIKIVKIKSNKTDKRYHLVIKIVKHPSATKSAQNIIILNKLADPLLNSNHIIGFSIEIISPTIYAIVTNKYIDDLKVFKDIIDGHRLDYKYQFIFIVFREIVFSVNELFKRGIYYTDMKIEQIFWRCDGNKFDVMLGDIDDLASYVATYPYPTTPNGVYGDSFSLKSSQEKNTSILWSLGILLLNLTGINITLFSYINIPNVISSVPFNPSKPNQIDWIDEALAFYNKRTIKVVVTDIDMLDLINTCFSSTTPNLDIIISGIDKILTKGKYLFKGDMLSSKIDISRNRSRSRDRD